MRIILVEPNLEQAAVNAAILQDAIPAIDVIFGLRVLESISVDSSDIVIADPAPSSVKDWITEFRKSFPNTHLVITSAQPDVLKGSVADKSYALSKPFRMNELVQIVKGAIVEGGPILMVPGKSLCD